MRLAVAAAVIALTGVTVAASVTDLKVPSATLTINETQFGFLLGGNLGGGTLSYGGTTRRFRIGGISVGDLGVTKVRGFGRVYNLTRVEDFAGTYSKLAVSATLISGSGTLRLKNEHDVVIELDTTSKGLQLSAGAGGVKITLK